MTQYYNSEQFTKKHIYIYINKIANILKFTHLACVHLSSSHSIQQSTIRSRVLSIAQTLAEKNVRVLPETLTGPLLRSLDFDPTILLTVPLCSSTVKVATLLNTSGHDNHNNIGITATLLILFYHWHHSHDNHKNTGSQPRY